MAPLLEYNFIEEGNASSSSFPLIVDELPKNDSLLPSEFLLFVPELDDDDVSEATPPCRKSVSFRENVRIRECLHIANYTDEEVQDCWYTKWEMDEIKEDIYYTRKLMVCGQLEQDTAEFCRRGSEQYMREDSRRRNEVKVASYEAVFVEQELQWESGVSEPDYIAHFYKTLSHMESRRAFAVAMQDHMEVIM
mmetsp:Transcript_124442/g.185919  ORF Transcript_124442/g.185919 Transcript_124442/m.185919 type:complete len:193 (+) Transcript_124442:40-618(+)|eukprot:CAMPEP_0117045780 /NCGR_PEP_ID=MMETSP0472-20121206/31673_1 /TAXON_ID=693140 ORGANISM="Tiarina fusus, Strain LIS" /NCGR_SAMPLE_ID=MMETSP0472 /ASSEMBLY_ACC=CAM_ASM_000603 /LENGTH=192 /DNA_ID=CAMNT_0004757917 /DNA_START=40 /DNA_END=618 /DNA_ORIENTATION=+